MSEAKTVLCVISPSGGCYVSYVMEPNGKITRWTSWGPTDVLYREVELENAHLAYEYLLEKGWHKTESLVHLTYAIDYALELARENELEEEIAEILAVWQVVHAEISSTPEGRAFLDRY